MRSLNVRVFAALIALVTSACASPDPFALYRDDRSTARPSNSSVLYPGEFRSQREWELWRLPQF